jgi:hypothetical protein
MLLLSVEASTSRLVTVAGAITRFWRLLPNVAQDRHRLRAFAQIVGGLPASCGVSHERSAIRERVSDNSLVRHSRLLRGKGSKLG